MELEPERRVEWQCVDGHDAWSDNTFIFGIEARGEPSVCETGTGTPHRPD